MPKREGSVRALAESLKITHTGAHKVITLQSQLEPRGLYAKFRQRLDAGERDGKILADLAPDILAANKQKQQINQYRSTVRWLL